MVAERLAKLAVSRGRLRHAISTARACGDSQWVWKNRPALDELDRRIASLVRVLPLRKIEEAREITNADF